MKIRFAAVMMAAAGIAAAQAGKVGGMVRTEEGAAVANAWVSVNQFSEPDPQIRDGKIVLVPFHANVQTKADGTFVVERVPAGSYRVCAVLPNTEFVGSCDAGPAVPLLTVAAGQTANAALTLARAARLKVRVDDKDKHLAKDRGETRSGRRSGCGCFQSGWAVYAGEDCGRGRGRTGLRDTGSVRCGGDGGDLERAFPARGREGCAGGCAAGRRRAGAGDEGAGEQGAAVLDYGADREVGGAIVRISAGVWPFGIGAPLVLLLVISGEVNGQASRQNRRYAPLQMVPPAIRQVVDALGPRVQRSGNERLTLTGTLTGATGASTLRVVREWPAATRIDETGGKGQSAVVTANRVAGRQPLDARDEELLEALDADSPEYFLDSLQSGGAVRLLGHRFLVRGRTGFGAAVDIFELTAPVRARNNKEPAVKKYMFDSMTGLLAEVSYNRNVGGRLTRIKTEYSEYVSVNGHLVPGRIRRVVDGQPVFTFVRQTAAISPALEDGTFDQP